MVEQIVITQEERERGRERARVVRLVLGIGNLSGDGLVVSSL